VPEIAEREVIATSVAGVNRFFPMGRGWLVFCRSTSVLCCGKRFFGKVAIVFIDCRVIARLNCHG
jgi:hypothetical protein